MGVGCCAVLRGALRAALRGALRGVLCVAYWVIVVTPLTHEVIMLVFIINYFPF